MNSQWCLDGRVALVTGGSRGSGVRWCSRSRASGADVVILSRKQNACEELAAEVTRTTGRRALPYAGHVGHWDELEPLVDAAYGEFGRVDVLVNNAGMSPIVPEPREVTEDLFDKVIAVNLKGPFRLTALVGGAHGRGRRWLVVNISSVAAIRPTPGELPYAAAKSGLDVLTIGFAQAYGPKVRVNTIMAGPFFTDISKAWDMPAFERAASAYPLGRGGRPGEIVGAALYLASDASSFTTGSILRVDGGQAVALR